MLKVVFFFFLSNITKHYVIYLLILFNGSNPVPFLTRLAISLTDGGKPGMLEKSGGIVPRSLMSGKHRPITTKDKLQ